MCRAIGRLYHQQVAPPGTVNPAPAAVRRSISSFPCIILNQLIQHCYPFVCCRPRTANRVWNLCAFSLPPIVIGPPTDANNVPALTYLESTLMKYPASVATKELTGSLNPLDATLTKNRGWVGVMVNQTPDLPSPDMGHGSPVASISGRPSIMSAHNQGDDSL